MSILGYRALTKIQSVALIAIVLVAAVGGGAAYVLWSASQPPPEAIRIGVCGDLDMPVGEATWRGAVLAAEQVNAEGGVLGRNLTIVAEDDDSGTLPTDLDVALNALTKLITVDKADFIIAPGSINTVMAYQDIAAEHNKILFGISAAADELTQRVLDNYDRYKYYFRACSNATSYSNSTVYSVLSLGNYTGFTKVAYLTQDVPAFRQTASTLNSTLPRYGFEVVYGGLLQGTTMDFTSYFAAIEASGAEILVPLIGNQAAVPFAREYYDRQSPFVVWGSIFAAAEMSFWNLTEGKCEFISFRGQPTTAGYPVTGKTIPTREAYIKRWGEIPSGGAVFAYDVVRFILPDAIKRAGTTEAEAVIKALETTDVETSMVRSFVFTSSHDTIIGTGQDNIYEGYYGGYTFQWQNGTQVPVDPKQIMEEAGATYKYPPWQGPWSGKQTP